MKFSKHRFKGILAGMLLGDGCVGKTNGTCYYRMQHTAKQKEYFDYKVKLLESLTKVTIRKILPRGRKHPNIEYVATSRTHPIYKRARDILYSTGRKEVNDVILSWLTPEGIAIWYMDDGSIQKGCNAKISTCSFGEHGNKKIVEYFKSRYGIEFKIYKGKEVFIYANKENTIKFFKLISPYVIESMRYKLRMRGTEEFSEEPVRTA